MGLPGAQMRRLHEDSGGSFWTGIYGSGLSDIRATVLAEVSFGRRRTSFPMARAGLRRESSSKTELSPCFGDGSRDVQGGVGKALIQLISNRKDPSCLSEIRTPTKAIFEEFSGGTPVSTRPRNVGTNSLNEIR